MASWSDDEPERDPYPSGESEEVVFNDAGDYIETNLITADDIKSYRLHVATEEGSKGAPLEEALPAMDLAKIIYKRRKNKQIAEEAEERAKSIEKLKERIAPDKKKKKKRSSKSRSKSPKIKREARSKSPKIKREARSKSPKIKREARSKSPKIKREARSKSPKIKRKYRTKSPVKSRSKSPAKSKSDKKSPKRKSRSKSRSKSPKKKHKSKSRSRSKSPSKSSKSKARSKSPSKTSKARSKSPSKASKSRKKSRSRSKSPRRKRSRSPKRVASSRRRSRPRHRSRSKRRSRSRDKSRRHSAHRHKRPVRRRVWESRSRSKSRSTSKDREEYIKKCKSVQDGPDLPVSRPVDRRRRRRSRSRSRRSRSASVERPRRGLPTSSSYLAIEGPEVDKALVTLYPSATPSIALPTLDRVRLPQQLAQQLFPVSCGAEHKTEEAEKAAASVLAIEGGPAGAKDKEDKAPPTLSEIMTMRIEANKLIVKNPTDSAAKKILHEAQIMMNKWQASTAKNASGRYTGVPLATPMGRDTIDHPATWARKDMFMNLKPITESPGMAMMRKMGWSTGEGLGKESTGDVNPLQLSVKTDRKGLMNTAEEVARKRPGDITQTVGVNWVIKIVNGKHAVSGLGELHQHIGRPCPEYIDHPTAGVYQITTKTAWGQFTPPAVSATKKEAKGRSALWAVKQITLVEAGKYNQTPPEECPTSGVMSVLFVPTKPSSGVAKYNAHFSNNSPSSASTSITTALNKVYANIKKISQSLPQGVPHLLPPAQQRPGLPTAQANSLQQSINNMISNQRGSACNIPNNTVPNMAPGMKPAHLMANIARLTTAQNRQPNQMSRPAMRLPRPGSMPQMRPRNSNMGPVNNMRSGGRPGGNTNQYNAGSNLAQMAALASRIMTSKQNNFPPPRPQVPVRSLPEPRVVTLPRTTAPTTSSTIDSTPPNEISSWLRTSL